MNLFNFSFLLFPYLFSHAKPEFITPSSTIILTVHKTQLGVATLAGRKSILKLAQRMTRSFCRALGASSYHTWNKAPSKTGDDIRIASRKNFNDPGEPLGVVLCAVSSVWLPVSHHILFDFLRDETRRNEVSNFLFPTSLKYLHFFKKPVFITSVSCVHFSGRLWQMEVQHKPL